MGKMVNWLNSWMIGGFQQCFHGMMTSQKMSWYTLLRNYYFCCCCYYYWLQLPLKQCLPPHPPLQALTRTLLISARTHHQPHRKRERRRGRMASWRSRKCWCSTWETQKPLLYKWRGQSLSLTPCSIGKPLQVEGTIPQNANLFQRVKYFCIRQLKSLVLVVQEAVQFCVTVCEFSVANSVSGVRKMLPLVWSTDAAIKDAVVQAYRRLYLNPQGDTIRSVKQLHAHMTDMNGPNLENKYTSYSSPRCIGNLICLISANSTFI